MKKLGIAIQSTLQGSGEPLKINPGAWDAKIEDVSDIIHHVPSLGSDPGRSIAFFSFSQTGCYITLVRCYADSPADYIAGWIFVPADIRISGEELFGVLLKMRDVIFQTELPDIESLRQDFSSTFPDKEVWLPYTPSPKNGLYAKRSIHGKYTIRNILSCLWQPAYEDFEAIILEERPGEVVDATNLSDVKLQKFSVIAPPPKDTVNANAGAEVEIIFAKNDKPFNRIIRVPLNSSIPLKAVRKGYEPFHFKCVADTEAKICEMPEIDWGSGLPAPEGPVIAPPTSKKDQKTEGTVQRFNKDNVWIQRLIGFIAAIVLGGIVVGILALCGVFGEGNPREAVNAGYVYDDKTEGFDDEASDAANSSPAIESLQEADDYLDTNTVWKKEEMEKYKALQGLYEDLNTFNFNRINKYWSQRLKGSSVFTELVRHGVVCQEKSWHPEYRTAGGTFNPPGDDSINIINYMNWINNECRNARQPEPDAESKPISDSKTSRS